MGGDPNALQSGELVERYQIRSLLGAGGMGQVYRAFDTKLRRQVALKILHPEFLAEGSDASARMLREARAAALLAHPNVVAIYDVGEVEEPPRLRGTTYLAMEFVPGTSLRNRMETARVSRSDAIRWLLDVARALAAAHDVGLVHRDIKPDNVMLREDGVVKVLDFGIARRANRGTGSEFPGSMSNETESRAVNTITAKGVAVGTPLYMSPEQMRCEKLDGRADQFSWGVMAYELLLGAPPWNIQGTSLQLVAEILSMDVSSPHEIDPSVPEPIAAVVKRALEKDARRRFPSMHQVVDALQRASELAPSSGRDVVMQVHADAKPLIRTEVLDSGALGKTSEPNLPPSSTPDVASANGAMASTPNAPPSGTAGTGNTTASIRPKPLWPFLAAGTGVVALVIAIGIGAAAFQSKPSPRATGDTTSALSPAATTPASASPAPLPSVAPRINITIRATPPEATIQVDDGPQQPNPLSLEAIGDGSKHRVTVRAPGMTESVRSITYDNSQTMELALVPSPAEAASAASAKPRSTTARAGTAPPKPSAAPPPSAAAAPVVANSPPTAPASTGPSKRPLDMSNPYKD